MNPAKRKHTFMDKFVCKISKNDDDRSTIDQNMSTPTLTSLDTKCEVAFSKLQTYSLDFVLIHNYLITIYIVLLSYLLIFN